MERQVDNIGTTPIGSEPGDPIAGDPALNNDWHVVLRAEECGRGQSVRVRLGGRGYTILRRDDGSFAAVAAPSALEPPVAPRATEAYGLVWMCPGSPARGVPPFPQFADPEYQTVLCGPYGVATSAPRIIENFLDMAHFPFIHPGILGQEPDTEVAGYKVEVEAASGDLMAIDCAFWQPPTSVLAHGGSVVNYAYRVAGPLSAILTKLPEAPGGNGVSILLTVQPIEPETSVAWILFATTNRQKTPLELRAHQERIFMQDKPILENQQPKRLPLGPKDEMALPCDRLSIAYRRYLSDNGMRFGVIPRKSD
ncbi:MAG: aromatic ring-hydroxylating dioxygenase subunit alpha [Betaproteobacteria bacterium]